MMTGVWYCLLLAVPAVALSADCPDYDILMQFYKATGGAGGWFHTNGWGDSGKCCGVWRGIKKCDADAHVTHIDLAGNNLTQQVPPSVFELPSLQSVDLGYNQLIGSLPPFPSKGQLSYVGVYSNHLTGVLPVLPAMLSEFDAHSNHITGELPKPLPVKLTKLLIQDNELSGLLPPLPDTLTMFNVYGNHLEGELPQALPSQLVQLSVSDNNFTGSLPTTLPAGLKQLLAFDNVLTQIPATLQLPSGGLQNCLLGGNAFKCPIPQWALDTCDAKCT